MVHRLVKYIVFVLALAALMLNAPPVYADGGTADYLVKGGDTLSWIAAHYGLTIEQVLAVNPQITDQNLIISGATIVLPPGRSEDGPSNPYSPTGLFSRYLFEQAGGKIVAEDRLYQVRGGDNMTRIAAAYGLTLDEVLAENPNLGNGSSIYAGQLVRIPTNADPTGPPFYVTP